PPVRFLVDMGLSVAVAMWLRGAGHDAVHLRELGLQRAADGAFSPGRTMAGRLEQARTAMTRLRQLYPLLRVSKLEESFPLRRSEDVAGWAEDLRKAGLPE